MKWGGVFDITLSGHSFGLIPFEILYAPLITQKLNKCNTLHTHGVHMY